MKGWSYTSTPPIGRTACTEPQCLYKGTLQLFYLPTTDKRQPIMGWQFFKNSLWRIYREYSREFWRQLTVGVLHFILLNDIWTTAYNVLNLGRLSVIIETAEPCNRSCLCTGHIMTSSGRRDEVIQWLAANELRICCDTAQSVTLVVLKPKTPKTTKSISSLNNPNFRIQFPCFPITTCYGLDGTGIESRWWSTFSAPVQTSGVPRGVWGVQPPPEIPNFWQSRTGLYIERKMFSVPIPTS